MSNGPQETQSVTVDVLPPLPEDARIQHRPEESITPAPPLSGLRTFFHPASGVVIIGIDLLVFGPEMLSGFFGLPLLCPLTFVVTLPLLYMIQWKWSRDSMAGAFGKAFLGAFVTALPFSITGTVLGAAVLALSGLPSNPREVLKKLTSPSPR